MNKKFVVLMLLSALSITFTGCSSLTAIAPSTTPITSEDTYTKLGKTKGRSYDFEVLFIPFFSENPVKIARDNAIKKGGGNALVEVTVEQTSVFLFIYNAYWTTVSGTAVQVTHKGAELE